MGWFWSSTAALLRVFFEAFVRNLIDARGDNEHLFQFVYNLVQTANNNPELKTGIARREYVQEQAKRYLYHMGLDLKESLINTVIELAVQRVDSDNAAK